MTVITHLSKKVCEDLRPVLTDKVDFLQWNPNVAAHALRLSKVSLNSATVVAFFF